MTDRFSESAVESAALHRTLLSKLIRGGIRVKEAERFVQDFGGERR
jgi:hypothetical protein